MHYSLRVVLDYIQVGSVATHNGYDAKIYVVPQTTIVP